MLAAAFCISSANGQSIPSGQRFGSWTYQCQGQGATDIVCGLVQNVADSRTGKSALSIGVRPIEGKLAMFVVAPLGIFLGSGIGGRVDNGPAFQFFLQECTRRGCQAALPLRPDMLELLRKGKRLLVGYKTTPQAPLTTVPVSLDGFSAGVEALGAK